MWHITKPLLRRPLMPLLIVLQITVACAIACNALSLLQQKLTPIVKPTGIARPGQMLALWHFAGRGHPWNAARLRAVEADLRAVPGVKSASYALTAPGAPGMRLSANVVAADDYSATRAVAPTYVYLGDHLIQTLGLRLVAGRDFSPAETGVSVDSSMGFGHHGPVIITRALATHLFPDGHAVGQRIGYAKFKGGQRTVIGVVARLTQNYHGQNNANLGYSMLFPGVANHWPRPNFVVRIKGHSAPHACKKLEAVIQQDLGAQMLSTYGVHCDTLAALHHDSLARPRAAVWLLAGVTLIVLIVTLTGVMGLTGYWVQQRTRAMGIRRALGATRANIRRYVQTENLLIVTIGVVLGLVAAYGVNLWLMQHYELTRMPWQWLPIGAGLLLVLGQLAALAAALRASHVAPVVATRTV